MANYPHINTLLHQNIATLVIKNNKKILCVSKKNCNFVAFLIIKLRSMKKSTILFGVVTIVAMVMVSCQMDKPTFREADLLGLWQENGQEAFVRFTNEPDPTGEYKYGCEWNEDEGVFESELKQYGNGWFKYKLVKSDLTEIHLMDNGGAVIFKEYVVVKLNEYELQYEDGGKRYYYHKCRE